MRKNSGFTPKARTDRLVVEPVDDELLVYDLDRDEAHSLDRTAAHTWRACDGSRDVTELAAVVGAELAEAVSDEVITSALSQLEERHLLDAEATLAMAKPEFSRRQALIRIGATGAAAGLALPVIKSIIAPTPASAVSVDCGNAAGTPCGTWDGTACTGGVPCCSAYHCFALGSTVGDTCVCLPN